MQDVKIIVTEREHNINSSTNDDSNSINDSNSQLPKKIQVQPLNMAQDEVSRNLQNTDNLQDIKIIVEPPIDDIETEREHNNEALAVLDPIPLPLLCINNNRYNKGLISIGGLILLFAMLISFCITHALIFDSPDHAVSKYIPYSCVCVMIIGFPAIYFLRNPGHLITAINDLPF